MFIDRRKQACGWIRYRLLFILPVYPAAPGDYAQ